MNCSPAQEADPPSFQNSCLIEIPSIPEGPSHFYAGLWTWHRTDPQLGMRHDAGCERTREEWRFLKKTVDRRRWEFNQKLSLKEGWVKDHDVSFSICMHAWSWSCREFIFSHAGGRPFLCSVKVEKNKTFSRVTSSYACEKGGSAFLMRVKKCEPFACTMVRPVLYWSVLIFSIVIQKCFRSCMHFSDYSFFWAFVCSKIKCFWDSVKIWNKDFQIIKNSNLDTDVMNWYFVRLFKASGINECLNIRLTQQTRCQEKPTGEMSQFDFYCGV